MKLAVLLLLAFLGCAALNGTSEYAECHALERRYPSVGLTMPQAQALADRITCGEHVPRIVDVEYYEYLAESVGDPDAVAVYFENTQIVYSRRPKIAFNVMVHEITHAVCAYRHLKPGHGPEFVAVERELFERYALSR